MKLYSQFKDDMGMRESSNRYDCINRFGFLGRFQFGIPRLIDLGLVSRKGIWLYGLSQDEFLSAHALQDAAFDSHISRLSAAIRSRRPTPFGPTETCISGLCAVAHLVGFAGLYNWVNGADEEDGLGTTAEYYFSLFKGYDIPKNLPLYIPPNIICESAFPATFQP
jgi:hypothetical protein